VNRRRFILTFLFFLCFFPSFVAADYSIFEDKIEETQGRGLSIRTNPDGVKVFIDNVERGITPINIYDLTPGIHNIRLTLEEYRERYFQVTLSNNSRLDVAILMIEAIGYARVSVLRAVGSSFNMPFAPQLTSGSQNEPITTHPLAANNTATINMRAGMRTFKARAFGWEDETATVLISERNPATVNIYMKQAAFSIKNFSQSRKRLNPKNTGNLGATEYRFEVSTYGYGNLTVFDSKMAKVYERNLGRFDTWVQSAKWDGKDSSGNPLPEGNYIAVIEASPVPEYYVNPPEAIAMTLETRIDYSLNVFPMSLSGGIPGMIFAPLPHTLSAGSFQIDGSIFFGSFHTPENNINGQYEKAFSGLPFEIGFRVAPVNRLEISSVFNVHPRFDNPTGWGFTGSAKFNILNGGDIPLFFAAGFSYAWASEDGEAPLSPGRGIGLYAPLSLELSYFSIVFSPAVFWRVPDGPIPALLLSAGLLYRGEWMNAGPSLRAEIDFSAAPVADNVRFLAGAEARFYPPPSNFVFFFQTGLWTQKQKLGGYGGAGIGVIF
jgi:hypothetical protein